jgi:alpha-D-ribose 1-methylphosphonate 5-triphosphate synthase subunit PhnG
MPAPLTGMGGYTLAAITAAVGALQIIPWDDVIRHPETGYVMVATAVGTAVARAVLPGWLQWFVLKGAA